MSNANVKPANRIPLSLRLPPSVMDEVDAYARREGVRKTDAFLHLLNMGIQAQRERNGEDRLAAIESRLDEVLAAIEDMREPSSFDLMQSVTKAVASAAVGYAAIDRVYVFGSIARGCATAESDIDLRVIMGEGKTMNLHDLEHFCKEVEQRTGRAVDAVTVRTVKNAGLAKAIERDKVLIYEREKH